MGTSNKIQKLAGARVEVDWADIPADAPEVAASEEQAAFEADLLESIRQMHAGEAARVTQVRLTPAAAARTAVGVSQSEFARMLNVSVKTLQNWEQGRREPTGAAQTLLKIAASHPNVLRSM